MKKCMFLLGVAVAALASCTNEEVVSVPENAAIKFAGAFVDKATKADVTTASITNFWVFGDYDNSGSWVDVFNNVKVTGNNNADQSAWTPEDVAYWQATKSYNFGAYADGTTSNSNVEYAPATNTLTFTDYTAADNDLIAATATGKSWNGTGEPDLVDLSFKHMLAKVKFTFKTNAAETYTMAVTNLKINNAIKTATGTFTTSDVIDWNGTVTGSGVEAYGYENITDFATATQQASSEVQYVIPQPNTNNATVSFTVSYTDGSGAAPVTKEVTGVALSINTENEWKAGYSYNYVTTIDPDDINDKLKPIQFDVIDVDPFENDQDVDFDIQ